MKFKSLNETYWIDNKEVMDQVSKLGKDLEADGFKFYSDRYSGSTYYDFYTKRGDNGAICKAVQYSYEGAQIIDITIDQLIGKDPIDSFETMRRKLGKMLLPQDEALEDDFDLYMKASDFKCKLSRYDVEEAANPDELITYMEDVYTILSDEYGAENIKWWKFYEDDDVDFGYKVCLKDGSKHIVKINNDRVDEINEAVNPADLTDCPECGGPVFDSKRGVCTKCSYRESLTESATVKHLYYAPDPGALKRGQWLDVKEENGRIYAKWNFSDEWSDITDEIEEMPHHHVVGNTPSKTFTFGGWRYWMDDEVEKFWEREGHRIRGNFEIPGMPNVRRDNESKSIKEDSSCLTRYVICGVTNEGTRMLYDAVNDNFTTDYDSATKYDDMDAARDDWFKIPRSGFRRIFIPIYDPAVFESVNEAESEEPIYFNPDDEFEIDFRYYVYSNNDDVVSDAFDFEEDAIQWAQENNYPIVKIHNYYRDIDGQLNPDGDSEVIWEA